MTTQRETEMAYAAQHEVIGALYGSCHHRRCSMASAWVARRSGLKALETVSFAGIMSGDYKALSLGG